MNPAYWRPCGRTFFKLLDEDAGGAIEIEEFLMGCLRLRGQARAMELAKIIQDQSWLIKNQGLLGVYVETEIGQLRQDLTHLVNTIPICCAGDDATPARSREV